MWRSGIQYTRIKLCLFEAYEAALEASSLGIDALGFHILRENPEAWQDKARRFAAFLDLLPSHVDRVLLCDYAPDVIAQILRIAPFDTVQLYPDCKPSEIRAVCRRTERSVRILKVMSVKWVENCPQDPMAFIRKYESVVHGFLLDSARVGGTGRVADIRLYQKIIAKTDLPVFLAGGLTPSNVGRRIRLAKPFGVDVETGVSSSTPLGLMKDIRKCQAFVRQVAEVDRELLREQARVE